MKFGKYLEARQLELAEYNSHFIDYKALKKLIKQLAIPTLKTSSDLDLHLTLDDIDEKIIHQRLQENKAAFFFKLERELEKVNGYYLARESDLRIKFNILHSKYKDYKLNGKLNSNQATSFKNLYAAFKKFQKDLRNLEQYVELNKTGFSKALKKWDKRSQSHDKDFYLATVVSIQPIFTRDGPLKLNDETLHILLELNDIDNNSRRADLQSNTFSNDDEGDDNNDNNKLKNYELATSKTSENQLEHLFPASSSSLDMEMEIENWYKEILNIATVKDIQRKHALLRNFREAKIFAYLLQNSSESFHKNVFSLLKECLTTLFLLLVASPLDDNSLHIFYKSNQEHIDLSYCDEDDQVFSRKNVFHEAASCPNKSRLFILDEALTTSKLSKETVQKLLNARDIHARIPLHYAAELGKLEFVHSLLITNLLEDIDPIDSDSKTPLVLAITNNHIDVVRDLLTIGGANASPIEKPILDYSKNTISSTKVQFDPLNVACKFNNHDAAKLLLEIRSKQNADRSKNEGSQHLCQPLFKKNSTGLCTLHIVAKIGGDPQLIQLLIHYGADPNEIDGFNKWTPIFYAVRSGHSEVISELLKNRARLDIEDGNGHSPLFYALWESHVGVLNALLQAPINLAFASVNELNLQVSKLCPSTIGLTPHDEKSDLDIQDSIPDFALPPPIIPLRKYGHNFLEKKIFIKLKLKSGLESIKLTQDNGIIMSSSPGRITLSSNLPEILPRNVILPVRSGEMNNFCKDISETNDEEDDEEISEDHDDGEIIFQVDSVDDFSMDFEIFPSFGTRIIAKTTAMPFLFKTATINSIATINLPLFDTRLNNIGCLTLDYQIIFPYPGNPLKIIKYEPYWKSTGSDLLTSSKDGNLVTSSSLNGSFISILVCTLNDETIVAAPKPYIEFKGTKILLNDLTKGQLEKLVDYDFGKIDGSFDEVSLKQYLSSRVVPLRSLLEVIPGSVQLVICVCFPTDKEIDTIPIKISPFININQFIDKLLLIIFEHERFLRHSGNEGMRQIVFSSCNWEACSILNWKQPNFPVLLQMKSLFRDSTTGKFMSDTPNCLNELAVSPQKMSYLNTEPINIHTMVQFAMNNNLLGVTLPYEILKICPSLARIIKQNGLLLIASVNENEQLPGNVSYSGIYCTSELLFEGSIDM
ncbi:AIS_HP2_G0020990.mRNA.1.CDS.1 [Saccharomyces cerevisiae]|nr:AIS_HP2_G0020990.mRNA.1.CDS.1 [Saccharomyces cerevisiae]CAI6532821.1 AIS_HP2_G0020990.mRNA.1.CDS.1 [Saccharomyces cerevisiae]